MIINPFDFIAAQSYAKLIASIRELENESKDYLIVFMFCIVAGLDPDELVEIVDAAKFQNSEIEETFLNGLEIYANLADGFDPENN